MKPSYYIGLAGILSCLMAGCQGEKIIPLPQDTLVPPPLTVTIKVDNFCPQGFVDFFLKPMSFEVKKTALQQDTNRDGLTDLEAAAFGLSPFDQPSTGITDFIGLEFLGLTPGQLPSIPVCPNSTQASSGDVLTDCQKNALGLLPLSSFDSPHRGFPDSLALYARLPLFNNDVATQDLAGDGVPTIQKIKWNLPPDEIVTNDAMTLAVITTTSTYQSAVFPGTTCYNFSVTSPRAGVENGDLYNLYFVSTSVSLWSTATVTLGSKTMTAVSSTSGILPGMIVSGANIAAGTTVVSVGGSTVNLSLAATGPATGKYLFMGPSPSGKSTLVTKGIVVPPTAPSGVVMEYDYDAL